MRISKEQINQYKSEQRLLRAKRKKLFSDTAYIDSFINEYQVLCQTQIESESLNYLKSFNGLLSNCSIGGKKINIGKYIDEEKRVQQLKQDIYDAAMDAYSVGDYVDCKRFLDVVGDEGQLYSEIQGKVQEAERIRKAIIRRRVSLISCFSIMCVVVAVLLAIYVVIPHNILSKAQELSEMAQYTESINQYEDLKNYKQSKSINENSALYRFTFLPSDNSIDELIIETKYLRAIQALDKQDYDYALSEFQALGAYKEAETYSKESIYKKAKVLAAEKEYQDAITLLVSLKSYKDSDEQIINCKDAIYTDAKTLWDNQKFDASNELFEYLENYKNCNEFIHKHEYQRQEVINQPTCTLEGLETVKCWCGSTTERTISALGHNYKSVTTKKASCESSGEMTYSCKTCGSTYTEKISATGHSFTKADCTHDSHCKICGIVNQKALGHNYSNGACTRCGQVLVPDSRLSGRWYETYISVGDMHDINLSSRTLVYSWSRAFDDNPSYTDTYSFTVLSPTKIQYKSGGSFNETVTIELVSGDKIKVTSKSSLGTLSHYETR